MAPEQIKSDERYERTFRGVAEPPPGHPPKRGRVPSPWIKAPRPWVLAPFLWVRAPLAWVQAPFLWVRAASLGYRHLFLGYGHQSLRYKANKTRRLVKTCLRTMSGGPGFQPVVTTKSCNKCLWVLLQRRARWPPHLLKRLVSLRFSGLGGLFRIFGCCV